MFKGNTPKVFLIIMLLFISFIVGFLTNGPTFAAKKAEYKIINVPFDTAKCEIEFNKMASQGWELAEWGHQPTAVFKR
jgi:hypothetical protein